mgnify:CR=1 FL=1
MAAGDQILRLFETSRAFRELVDVRSHHRVVALSRLAGSAYAFVAAAALRQLGGIHIFVCEDRDEAAYFCNDLYALVGEERVLFFPTGYKRSARFDREDASGMVQRTAALNAVRSFQEGFLALCTYPDALVEKVADQEEIAACALRLRVGDRQAPEEVAEQLANHGFERVDFVYEPGQYSLRGGILDIFSFSSNRPFRIDYFDDEIASIRIFDISSQLSAEKVEQCEVLPDLKEMQERRVSFASFAGEVSWWLDDPDYMLARIDEVRVKWLSELEDPASIDRLATSAKAFVKETEGRFLYLRKESARRQAEAVVEFSTAPQPKFNKQFELLADHIAENGEKGYVTYLLSENRAQIERLQNIFSSLHRQVDFSSLPLTLHEGFVDSDLKICLYTDHQIFDRYHRYRIRGEIDRDESLTVAELNQLKVGDYVVHIDHGVGRFGGLVKSYENGKGVDAIKLVYRDNDVLLVNVHNLHRIARYKSGDSEPPKIYKLGSGAWQRMKNATKKAVKDIARELIALYAKRKASGGFAFSPDNYLQHELEASFIYEDTPDQQKATELVKKDMESPEPMDRLICGDVGFGKTEVAIRAAFKAVCDSKQVAVLVPTTILSLQHYRTFSERLRGFPVRVEHLNRSKSSKEVKQILEEVASGRIDILIGTHKILGKGVQFKDLGLLIIDEEQKFGVASKEKLRQMSVGVDTLTLTATPIPRTLQFSLMGSRDLSVISTPPANRQPIVTESHVFSEEVVREAIEFELARGGQVYYVHNRVEDIVQVEAMIRGLCPKARTVVVHGQMNAQQIEKLIMDFIYGEYDVLVATTIVENGIDIPNANTIIIDDAQRFGLSDLHQLRGRVGRSNRKAYCYLLSPPDDCLSPDARRRLRAIEEFSDLGSGFNIAMQDLDIRGAGNLFGAEQSGFIADIGFETYQKILSEAVAELRAEGLQGTEQLVEPGREPERVRYVEDCYIETDHDAELPDSYIEQSAEKLRLYRQLDATQNEEGLRRFTAELEDRFGPIPPQAVELIDVVRLRWRCVSLGFERAKVKNGLMILQFVGDSASPYYKSDLFQGILRYIGEKKERFVLRQNNNKLALTVRGIKNIRNAWETLEQIENQVIGTKA